MSKCNSVNLYESLNFCPGEVVIPGLYDKLYAVSKNVIIGYPTLPKPSDADATMESIATYDGSFTLAADANFFVVDIISKDSSLKCESQGELCSKTFLNTLAFKYAGNSAAAAGFCRLANNDDLLYVARQRDGQYRVIGNERFTTDTKPSQDSGASETDASGTSLEVTVTDVSPAPFYTGTLKTADGIIDCSTGKITLEED